jgi:hypothetical protein
LDLAEYYLYWIKGGQGQIEKEAQKNLLNHFHKESLYDFLSLQPFRFPKIKQNKQQVKNFKKMNGKRSAKK